MLICPSSQPDFSRGCAGMSIGHLLFATHPRRLTIRESTSAMASSSKGENGAGDVLPAPLNQELGYYAMSSSTSWSKRSSKLGLIRPLLLAHSR
jgi:hypothetical protein